MEDYVSFRIDGYCQPKQRTKFNFVTPPETRAYENLVKSIALQAMTGKSILTGPIGLMLTIECLVPDSWPTKKKHLAKLGKLFPTHCDLDNCVKSVCDGLNKICYQDDRQIQKLIVERIYGSIEHVFLTIYEIDLPANGSP